VSQIATFHAIERERLADLVEAATPRRRFFGRSRSGEFPQMWDATVRELEIFTGSGYHLGVVLTYLDEHGLPLTEGELEAAEAALSEAFGATTWVFTSAHKEHLDRLDAVGAEEAELRRYFEEFNEYEDPEAGVLMREGLAALCRNIDALDDGSLLLLTVG
jgi:hypothetical protein